MLIQRVERPRRVRSPMRWTREHRPTVAMATAATAALFSLTAVYHLAVFVTCGTWSLLFSSPRPANPLLTMRAAAAQRAPASLCKDTTSGASWSRRVSQSFRAPSMRDYRWVLTEIGTFLMIACVVESMYQMGNNSTSRALHIHFMLGFSRGFGLVLICVIVLAQACASVALLVPSVYYVTGAITPSVILACTLWFESLVLGDATDPASFMRAVALTLTSGMLALFRFDRQARNSREQVPTSGTLLGIEARVRNICTMLKLGIACPPLACVFLLWANWYHAYWRATPMLHEYQRSRFHMSFSTAALCFLAAGQDTKAYVWLEERFERLHEKFLQRREDFIANPRVRGFSLGAKKSI